MERLRSIEVTVSVDTNKDTREATLRLDENESIAEFLQRVEQALRERLPG